MEATTTPGERTAPAGMAQDTVCGAFQATAEDNADLVAIRTKGDELSTTWAEYAERVRRIAAGLAALGLERGQTIALMLTNRPEFHLVDAAATHLGATPFSVYNTYSAEQIQYLVSDAGNSIIVTEAAFLPIVTKVKETCDRVEHVVVVDEAGDGTMSLENLEGRGDESFDFEAAWRAVEPDDVLTLIYTSGTTGPPKGVQITHRNVMAAGRSAHEILALPPGSRVVSYLPMAHIAERTVSHYLPMIFGWSVTCCPNPREVVGYLPDVRPTWFFAVPRIFEKLKAAIEAGIEHEQDEERKKATKGALELGLRKVRAEQEGEELPAEVEEQWKKADEQVLSTIRGMLGFDQLEQMNVGAAPTPPEVVEFFCALGLPLCELWGMSETTGAGTANRREHIKIGTVGPPSPGIEIKLAGDGEVLVRGDVVMKGYRNQPDKTSEALDDDGWLHTGDIGEIDDDGFLKIVDRKKEIIINAAGKNMSPANIEARLKAAGPLIGQAIAIGDKRPYNVALLTLDPDSLPYFCQQHGLDPSDLEAVSKEEKVVEAVQTEVDAANEQLARVEQIKRFRILPTDWEPGGDELTPTMKLKRKPIAEKYGAEIEALYGG
ncbi:MAG: AMP-dependent synthetase/ligase [Thermoleophilaceae bacterium]